MPCLFRIPPILLSFFSLFSALLPIPLLKVRSVTGYPKKKMRGTKATLIICLTLEVLNFHYFLSICWKIGVINGTTFLILHELLHASHSEGLTLPYLLTTYSICLGANLNYLLVQKHFHILLVVSKPTRRSHRSFFLFFSYLGVSAVYEARSVREDSFLEIRHLLD